MVHQFSNIPKRLTFPSRLTCPFSLSRVKGGIFDLIIFFIILLYETSEDPDKTHHIPTDDKDEYGFTKVKFCFMILYATFITFPA